VSAISSLANTEAALLQSLHDRPGDDVAWLALADCLEEQDQPDRAELLRLSRALRTMRAGAERKANEGRLCDLLVRGVVPCVPLAANSVGMTFVLVPPGTFWMGRSKGARPADNAGPRHEVEITQGFYLGATLVTQEQCRTVMGTSPSAFSPRGDGADAVANQDTRTFPAERVTWTEAARFCGKLSRRAEEKAARRTYRLPTEAEWEYACRAGTNTAFAFGSRLTPALANVNLMRHTDGAPGPLYLQRPTPVGSYPPNGFGLYDMHGNVWEWCADWFGQDYYRESPRQDPTGPATGEMRILRGGCWYWHAHEARSAYRSYVDPGYRNYCVGFRVVMERAP
jgi:uncharacterized protein (TIGR02996 family)